MNAAAKLDACTDAIRRFNADMGRTAFECLAEIVTALNGGDNECGAMLLMRDPPAPVAPARRKRFAKRASPSH